MLIWEGNKLGNKRYTKKISICLLIIHFIIFNNSQIQFFPIFQRLLNSPSNFYTLKTFRKSSKIRQKLLNQGQQTMQLSLFSIK